MTRKHYRSIATLFAHRTPLASPHLRSVLLELANGEAGIFEADNPSFNRTVFLRACGFTPLEIEHGQTYERAT